MSRITVFIVAAVFAFGLLSCQSSGTKDKKVASLESSNIDVKKLKEEIVDIIMSLPDDSEIVGLINETGAAYVAGLTLEDVQADNLLTRAASARTYGGVLFDMAYANTYNQLNTFSKLLEVNETLVRKLGFEKFLSEQKDLKKRYEASKEVKDSVDQIVVELLNSSNDYIQEYGSASDISLVFAGATAKSLYVMSSVTLFAMNNDKLVELLENQRERVSAAYSILEKSGDDPEVKKMAEAIQPILNLYSESQPFNEATVEKIRELTSFVLQ